MRQFRSAWVVTGLIVALLLFLFVVVGIINHGLTAASGLAGIIGGIVAVVRVRLVRNRSGV